ncbi:MAG TPA: phosphoenolpyruvate-utilizing N-terminal domain-containing protein, partial [bacterium]|nr:phosphoenolpyruvate-utilizing N-terminal domain-containing protein [bacterium]
MKTRRFHSVATSPGIAIGRAHRLHNRGAPFARTWIRDLEVSDEVLRFRSAIAKSKDQLTHIQAKMCRYQGHDQIKIIESHRMFLQDDMLVATTIKNIEQFKINSEWALDKTLAQLKLSFLNVNEDYFRERRQDIDYVGRRVMDNLTGSPEVPLADLPSGELILVAHDLSPAEVASLPKDRVMGFVMEIGGETSHSAIISRALEIPAIFGVKEIFDSIEDGETIILDGIKGLLIASPHARELEQYRSMR